MIDKLYTVEEVAELASVTGRTIRNYLKSGRLVGRKIGGQWRFPEAEVQRLLTGAPPAGEQPQEAPDAGAGQYEGPEDEAAAPTAYDSTFPATDTGYGQAAPSPAPAYYGGAPQASPYSAAPPIEPARPAPVPQPVPPAPQAAAHPGGYAPQPPTQQQPYPQGEAVPAAPPSYMVAPPPYSQPPQPAAVEYDAAPPAGFQQPAPYQAAPQTAQSLQMQQPGQFAYPPEAIPQGGYATAVPGTQTAPPFSAPAAPPAPQYQAVQPVQQPYPSYPVASPGAEAPPMYQPQAGVYNVEPPVQAPGTPAAQPYAPVQPYPQQPPAVPSAYYPPPEEQAPPQAMQPQAPPVGQAASAGYPVPQQTPLASAFAPQENQVQGTNMATSTSQQETPTVPQAPPQQVYSAIQSLAGAFTPPAPAAEEIQIPKLEKKETDAETKSAEKPSPALELSDVGKQVMRFVAEVHDCSHGPQVCAVVELNQSLSAAKITSERLSDIAAQESETGQLCQSYVEFDERFYVARYTLFGTSSFLLRCIKLIG